MFSMEESGAVPAGPEVDAHVGAEILGVLFRSSEGEMFADVLDIVLRAFDSDFGFFGYIDSEGALVCPSMTREIWDACRVEEKSIAFPRAVWGGLWGRVLLEKRCLYKNEAHRVPAGHVPLFRSLGAPILYRDEVIGSIHVANRSTDYDERDRRLMENIASLIAPVLSARLERDREDARRRAAEEALAVRARELASANEGLQRANQELERRLRELGAAWDTIHLQRGQLEELSTPIVQIWDDVLVIPLVGMLDDARVGALIEKLLQRVAASGARFVLVDITGLPEVDMRISQLLLEATQAVRLLGGQVVLTGVRAAIAQTAVRSGVDLSALITRASLASGLRFALDSLGLRVIRTGARG